MNRKVGHAQAMFFYTMGGLEAGWDFPCPVERTNVLHSNTTCFCLIVFMLSCKCLCSVSLPPGTLDCSVICYCDISTHLNFFSTVVCTALEKTNVNIFLPISFNICLRCSKELSY